MEEVSHYNRLVRRPSTVTSALYGSWLETLRIGLLAGLLLNPSSDSSRYWNTITSIVKPDYLAHFPAEPELSMMDCMFDFQTADTFGVGKRCVQLFAEKRGISMKKNTGQRWK